MEAMCFPVKMRGWILKCVTSVQFPISMNGVLEGNFKGSRGLKQGDPVSPYLFLLIMKALSSLFKRKIQNGGFTFHSKCSKIQISHVCFADDLFIFAGANIGSIRVINDALTDFSAMSGLFPNSQKNCNTP